MRKKNLLFIGFDILLILASIILLIEFFFGFSNLGVLITGIFGLISCITSLFLIKKFNLELKKYNFLYVGSIVASVLYYLLLRSISYIYIYTVPQIVTYIIFALPTIVLPIVLTLVVKKPKECVVLFLSSPVIYFIFFMIMYGVFF